MDTSCTVNATANCSQPFWVPGHFLFGRAKSFSGTGDWIEWSYVDWTQKQLLLLNPNVSKTNISLRNWGIFFVSLVKPLRLEPCCLTGRLRRARSRPEVSGLCCVRSEVSGLQLRLGVGGGYLAARAVCLCVLGFMATCTMWAHTHTHTNTHSENHRDSIDSS